MIVTSQFGLKYENILNWHSTSGILVTQHSLLTDLTSSVSVMLSLYLPWSSVQNNSTSDTKELKLKKQVL